MKQLRKYWNNNNKRKEKLDEKKTKKDQKNKSDKNKEPEIDIDNIPKNKITERELLNNPENLDTTTSPNLDEISIIIKDLAQIESDDNEKEDNDEDNGIESEIENMENLEEMEQDFLDTKANIDIFNKKGKIINNNYNYYADNSGFLNNPKNPFIQVNKNNKEINNNDKISKNEDIVNKEKNITNLNNSENETKRKLKKNPNKLDKANAKAINIKDIKLDEINICRREFQFKQ